MIIEKIKKASAVELISIITPLLIIIGLVNKIGIYTSSQVDASWLISLFSPVDFMVSDLQVYIYYALAILYLEKFISATERRLPIDFLNSSLKLFGAFAGMYAFFYFRNDSTDVVIKFFSYTELSLMGFWLIFSKNKLNAIFGLMLIISVPYISGTLQARKISNGNLPIAELSDNKQWYLLDKYTDKAILIHKSSKANEFKIVEMKDINSIKK